MPVDPTAATDAPLTDDVGSLGHCGALVRRHAPERFLTALFAAPERRAALFALYAFNHEVAKTRESVSEPMLGEIRLQWWRDAVDGIYAGKVMRHDVVEGLAEAVAACSLSRSMLERLLDARAADLADSAPTTLEALEEYAAGTSGTVTQLALEVLGVDGEEAFDAGEAAGVAWALTGLLRALPHHVRARRRYLPDELVDRHGVDLRDMMEFRSSPALAAAVADVAATSRSHLRRARGRRSAVGRRGMPALLLCTLADGHLARMARTGYDPFNPAYAAPTPLRGLRLLLSAVAGRY